MQWRDILPPDIVRLGDELFDRAAREREFSLVCPPQEKIFRALQLCPPEKTKVVIIGQDPYHTPGQADGLCFSCAQGKPQPSLMNIFEELKTDMGWPAAQVINTELTSWAEQGVLLLNASLTVKAGQANSHSSWGWREFTKGVLRTALELDQPMVVILWGGYAQTLFSEINRRPSPNKLVIKSSHPSPFSCHKGGADAPAFMGSRPFSRANTWLHTSGTQPIDWTTGILQH